MVIIPSVIIPYGMFGSLISRFLYGTGTEPLPPPKYNEKTWPNAKRLAELCISDNVPSGILPRANDLWRMARPEEIVL